MITKSNTRSYIKKTWDEIYIYIYIYIYIWNKNEEKTVIQNTIKFSIMYSKGENFKTRYRWACLVVFLKECVSNWIVNTINLSLLYSSSFSVFLLSYNLELNWR